MLDGILHNDVITNIIYYMLAQCNMAGKIAHIRYHRINKNLPSQEKDELGINLQGSENKITILIPFTNLDVLAETTMTDLSHTSRTAEIVLCFVKPH